MRTHWHQPPVEAAVRAYSKLGEHGILWLAIAAAGAALDARRRARWRRAGLTVAGSFLANQAVKLAVRRRRPEVPGLPALIHTMSNRSYPSAHATTAGAACVALGDLLPPAILRPATLAMAATRPYLGVHYPSDSLAGFALGMAVALL